MLLRQFMFKLSAVWDFWRRLLQYVSKYTLLEHLTDDANAKL